jgi:hypothetical protein
VEAAPAWAAWKARAWKGRTAAATATSTTRRPAGRVPEGQTAPADTLLAAALRDLSTNDDLHLCYAGENAFESYSLLVMFKDASGQPLSDSTLASLTSAQQKIASLRAYQVFLGVRALASS